MTHVTAVDAMKEMFWNLREARPEFIRLEEALIGEMTKADRDPRKILDILVENAKLAMSITHESIGKVPLEEKDEVENIVNGFKASQDAELNELIREAEEFKDSLEGKAPEGVNSSAAVQLMMDSGLMAEYMERISVDVNKILFQE